MRIIIVNNRVLIISKVRIQTWWNRHWPLDKALSPVIRRTGLTLAHVTLTDRLGQSWGEFPAARALGCRCCAALLGGARIDPRSQSFVIFGKSAAIPGRCASLIHDAGSCFQHQVTFSSGQKYAQKCALVRSRVFIEMDPVRTLQGLYVLKHPAEWTLFATFSEVACKRTDV